MASNQLTWLNVLRRYLVFMAVGNLVWEFAHMPLFTLWETGSPGEIVFAALHCTAGDILVALSALTASLLLFGTGQWPGQGYWRVALPAIGIGLGYTLFSEWLNIEVREAWAYREVMPVVPLLNAGITPLAQWVILPSLAFWLAARGRGGP